MSRRPLHLLVAATLCACSTYEIRHEIVSNSKEQVWRSGTSQIALRATQSRVFETRDRTRTLRAVVDTFQDLGFQIEVLDEELGIVSGKRFEDRERSKHRYDPLYHLYDGESLLAFTKTYRSWGPFWHRSDLLRLTATVRPRSDSQLIVRTSAQDYLRRVMNPEAHLGFFRRLSKSMFVDEQLLD